MGGSTGRPGETARLCVVCDLPAEHTLGRYGFCAEHHRRALAERRNVWLADALALAALGVMVILAHLAAPLVPDSIGFNPTLVVLGVILALVPTAVWLFIIYSRDRLEPEPLRGVIGVTVLGALVAGAIGLPVVREIFAPGEWVPGDLLMQFLAGFLIVGLTFEGLKYVVIRFSAYESAEFDEPIDGIVYGTAAGLGFATALNIATVVEAGGAELGFAAINVAVTALAHGAFGGVIGFFLAGQKLENRPLWWSAAGILLAAALNSAYVTLRSLALAVDQPGSVLIGPWVGLLVGAVFAVLITLGLLAMMRSQTAAAARGDGPR